VNIGVVLLGLVPVDDAVTSHALVAIGVTDVIPEPGGFTSPVNGLIRLEDIGTTAREAERLDTHILEGDIADEEEEIGPGDLVAVLQLDGEKQATGLVEGDIVGPRVQRGETLLSLTTTATTIEDAVCAGAVPGQTDEETTVMAKVGGPEILRVGEEGLEVGFEGLVVERLEGLGVVESFAERVRDGGVLAEDAGAELVGPPIAVTGAAAADGSFLDGAFGHGGGCGGEGAGVDGIGGFGGGGGGVVVRERWRKE
jgi:hypothetical protein